MISSISNSHKLIPNSTSGSTGESLYFYTDMRSWSYRRAVLIRNQKWIGITLGDKAATIWGAPMDLKKTRAFRGRLHALITNVLFLSSYQLSDQSMQEFVKKLIDFKPVLLTSYPGPLTVFAEYLLKKGKTGPIPSIKAIISSAETLFPWQKEIIEKAFSCPVYNRYGCREFGEVAHECPAREGLHINADRLFIEILNENLEPALPGEPGELVITDMDNYGFPIIRYRIGDIASLNSSQCSCGRGLPLLQRIEGRVLDIIKAPNGNRLGGTFWTILFKSKPGIKAIQVFQKKIDGITVRYVRDHNVDRIHFGHFAKRIAEHCGEDFRIQFDEVSDIPKTVSGKTRIVVSELINQQ